ncbi:hypothetical protein GACE_2269 [Geoglobus acetivorans]|uniref:Uncharacterized protein n=1 Tax=Geoglobus acetivorans TaxID=565033 RepID=A0A0A7GBK8_GEOAI|nr:hypothetical protein GACE_2269 [Geoglobus acetivorans]
MGNLLVDVAVLTFKVARMCYRNEEVSKGRFALLNIRVLLAF